MQYKPVCLLSNGQKQIMQILNSIEIESSPKNMHDNSWIHSDVLAKSYGFKSY